jgi:hypothetical protein
VRTRIWLIAVVGALALAGCTGHATAGSPAPASTAGDQPAGNGNQPTDEPTDDVLDGRDPCEVLDRTLVGQLTNTEIVTADPQQGVVGCMYNEAEEGVTSAVYFYPASEVSPDKPAPGREGWTTAQTTVPGTDVAWLSTTEEHDQPEAEVCATTGEITSCAYTTAFLNVSMDSLTTMAVGLAKLLVEKLS